MIVRSIGWIKNRISSNYRDVIHWLFVSFWHMQNRQLKEERNAQNEKVKQMATKFARIMQDLKKEGKVSFFGGDIDGEGPSAPMLLQKGGGF